VVIGRLIGGQRRFRSSLIALVVIALFCAAISLSAGTARRPITDLACVLLIFPVLVWLATLIDPGTTWQKASTFLGLTSYAVYVLHTPLLAVLSSLARVHSAGVGLAWLGVAFLTLLLAVSWLIDSYYDAPVRRYLSRRLARATAAATRS
jgi:peptidoglycan/LPS O-acetylase OafA/YrhL